MLAWLAALLVVQVVTTLVTGLLFAVAPIELLSVVAAVSSVVGLVVAALAVVVAVLVLAAGGRAVGRPAWHWVAAGVPPLVLSVLVGLVVQVASLGRVHQDLLNLAVLVLELGIAVGVAVAVGTALRRSAERRAGWTPPPGPPPSH